MTDYLEKANEALNRLFTRRHNYVRNDTLAEFCDHDRTTYDIVKDYLKSNYSGMGWTGDTPYGDYDMGYFFDNPTEEQEKTYWLIYLSPKTFPFDFETKYLANSFRDAVSLNVLEGAEIYVLNNELTLAVTDSYLWLIRKKTFNKKSC